MTYTAGSVRVEGGSPYVIGVGTAFTANVSVGDFFWVAGDAHAYPIVTVFDDTHLQLAKVFAAKALNVYSGLAYSIGNQFTPNLYLSYPGPDDRDAQGLLNRAFKTLDKVIPNP